MIIETVFVSLIIAFIRGGKLQNIESINFKYWYLLILGYLVQLMPDVLLKIGTSISQDINYIFVASSYALIVIPLFFNLKIRGVYYALIGSIFNAIVILSNQAMMPVSKNSIIASGYDKTVQVGQKLDLMHYVADQSTKLNLLSDFIPIPKPYFMPQVLSVGDLLLSFGLFVLIQTILVKKLPDLQKVSLIQEK